MEKWTDLLTALRKMEARYPFAIGLLGIAILLLPISWANGLGIAEIREKYRGWVGIGVLLALTFSFIQVIPFFEERRRRLKQAKDDLDARLKREEQVLKNLEGLSPEERIILAECIRRGQRTIPLDFTNPAAMALCNKGLLQMVGRMGEPHAWPHTIPHFVWQYLNDHRESLFSDDQWPAVQQTFERLIQGVDWQY